MLWLNTLSVYGIVYALGFIVYIFIQHPLDKNNISYRLYISIYTSIATILGARIFYVVIYEPQYYLTYSFEIIQIFKGGMSFHGALIAIVVATFILDKQKFFINLDRASICAMLILPIGRTVNFLNGELYGRISTLPFAIIFEGVDENPRHPSQLYEAISEGPIIGLIILILYMRGKIYKPGQIATIFAMLYAIMRFLIEFTRQPDISVGFIFTYFTLGQILCFLQFILAFILYRYITKKV